MHPKYKCNINLTNKALDFINLTEILRSKEVVIHSCPAFLEQDYIPTIYTFTLYSVYKV